MIPPNNLSCVSRGAWRFVIFDAPSDATLPMYRDMLRDAGVKEVVRACDATYSPELLEAAGIHVHELNFSDGASPDSKTLDAWRKILHAVEKEAIVSSSPGASSEHVPKIIGVHCVAGLGRSPTLVAVALIDMGMSPADAVDHIRAQRKGAINAKQLEFLFKYKPVKKSGLFSSIRSLMRRGSSSSSLSSLASPTTVSTSSASNNSTGFGGGGGSGGGGGGGGGAEERARAESLSPPSVARFERHL